MSSITLAGVTGMLASATGYVGRNASPAILLAASLAALLTALRSVSSSVWPASLITWSPSSSTTVLAVAAAAVAADL